MDDLARALDRLTRPPLLTLGAALVAAASFVVVGAHLAGLQPPHGSLDHGTGDYLAFWTGGVALRDGVPVYDLEAQHALQRVLARLPPEEPSWQPYVNPPGLALAVAATVPLGYVGAFLAFVVASASCLGVGVLGACRALGLGRLQTATALLVTLAWPPVVQTLAGGQNSAISLGLLASWWAASRAGRPFLAALALGLLTYKPQYAVGVGLALLVGGSYRVLAGGVALGVLHGLVGALVLGPRWPLDMLHAIRLLEEALLPTTHISPAGAALALAGPAAASAVALGALALVTVAFAHTRHLAATADPAWGALVVTGAMVASPHLQYYDFALLALPGLLLLGRQAPSLGLRLAVGACAVAYPCWRLHETLGFQPLAPVLALAFLGCWRVATDRSAAAPGDDGSSRPP